MFWKIRPVVDEICCWQGDKCLNEFPLLLWQIKNMCINAPHARFLLFNNLQFDANVFIWEMTDTDNKQSLQENSCLDQDVLKRPRVWRAQF